MKNNLVDAILEDSTIDSMVRIAVLASLLLWAAAVSNSSNSSNNNKSAVIQLEVE